MNIKSNLGLSPLGQAVLLKVHNGLLVGPPNGITFTSNMHCVQTSENTMQLGISGVCAHFIHSASICAQLPSIYETFRLMTNKTLHSTIAVAMLNGLSPDEAPAKDAAAFNFFDLMFPSSYRELGVIAVPIPNLVKAIETYLATGRAKWEKLERPFFVPEPETPVEATPEQEIDTEEPVEYQDGYGEPSEDDVAEDEKHDAKS